MSVSIYTVTVPLLTTLLTNLSACLDKAVLYASERKFSPDVLVTSRLAPDMRPLSFQVQAASDHAKFSVGRVTGKPFPAWADDERTIDELKARIQKALVYLAGFSEADFEGADARKVTIKISGVDTEMTSEAYLLQRALPNFFFHVTTAYDILRHNGVPVGKRDFLGQ
jgi:uncharacterized protein